MGQVGGNMDVEGPADARIPIGADTVPEGSGSASSPDSENNFRKVIVFLKKHWIAIGIASTIGIVLSLWRWFTLPSNDRYLWPVTQDDWAAWGTWASAVGAIAAVAYASQSIKQAIETQKGTERELKADRQHDRDEREKERELVREERAELKQELDRIALHKASQLTFEYSWSWPVDSDYEEVQVRWHEADAERSALLERGIYPQNEENLGDREHDHAFVMVQNDLVLNGKSKSTFTGGNCGTA